MRVGGNILSSPVYELSTVPFPIPIKGIFFTKVINFWQSGKFRILNNILFADKTVDLRGQMMQVVVLEHTPAVLTSISNPVIEMANSKTTDDNNHLHNRPNFQTFTKLYYGVEVELLKAISKTMHFQMNFYETADAGLERWGTMSLNGTITGLLREMHEGRADFALADLHHTNYHLGFMDLSIPYNTECLTFLTPEALSDNSWKTLIMPFNGEMWAGVLFSLFSVGFVFYAFSSTMSYIHRHEKSYQPEYDMIKRSHRRRRKPKDAFGILTCKAKLARCKTFCNRKLSNSFLRCVQKNRKANTQSTAVPYSYNSNVKLQKIRMIQFKRKPEPWHDPLPPKDIFDSFAGCIIYTYSWYWIYCVLVVVAYRASFTAILANPIPRLTIDTLQDLAKSPIRCGAWGEQNLRFFQMADDPHSQIIGTKLEHAPNPQDAVDQVVQGMYAFYENIYLLRQLRSTQKSEKARQTLHIMKECVVNMPISIGLEKNSPIKSQVDRYVRALVEGGLTGKWLSDAIERFQSNVELPPQEATIDLTKMYAGIIALGIGYGISMVAFMAEKCYWVYFVESNPSFDKYLLGTKFRKQG
ncbi:AGAP007951-PA-like protein [Anopheles sinensis]|uniref:AGAP007951-PA-like protein n=1 Tax=Anopheles sinensis TaxID=74873 RepID=A0A084VNZ9_ANOSI|nr:AGAP007951-PA-like protein [Anopheles sinensis]